MAVLDVPGDSARAMDVLEGGGIALIPMDVGYTAAGGSAASLQRIFDTKGRTPDKRNAMVADHDIHREIHVIDDRARAVVEAITIEFDLPLGVIAPARLDHPLLAKLEPGAREGSIKDGTVCMLLNAGPFHQEICRLSRERSVPIFGSSANKSLAGTKFRVEDIEPELKAIADIVIDHGLRKYHAYQASSTLIDLTNLRPTRVGSCYALIQDIMRRYFDIAIPDAA